VASQASHGWTGQGPAARPLSFDTIDPAALGTGGIAPIRFVLYIGLLALTVLGIAAPASAATPKQQIKNLKHRAAVLTKVNVQLRRANAELETRASNFAVELAHTQVLLGTATQERNDLKSERDALKYQIDTAPSELARAVDTVQAERSYLEQHIDPSASDGYVISLAAMNYVVGHVLAGVYGYRVFTGLSMPWDAERALKMQAGICGTAAFTFAAIVRQFNLPVRSVQFYYGTNNHIAVEVFYDGAWHYFDPTWGAVFSDATEPVLSIGQARSGPFQLQRDQTLLWGEFTPLSDLTVLTAPSTVVEIGKDAL
jgi:hypothetical protein